MCQITFAGKRRYVAHCKEVHDEIVPIHQGNLLRSIVNCLGVARSVVQVSLSCLVPEQQFHYLAICISLFQLKSIKGVTIKGFFDKLSYSAQKVKGLSSKPSGNLIVAPNLCFLSQSLQIVATCLFFKFHLTVQSFSKIGQH